MQGFEEEGTQPLLIERCGSGYKQSNNKESIKSGPMLPIFESTLNVDGKRVLIMDKGEGFSHDESKRIGQSQCNTISNNHGRSTVGSTEIADLGNRLDSEESHPISSFGPGLQVKPKKIKQVLQVYENLKILFAPSYFSMLL